ncbi:hypothetical protein Daes_1677 [Pseudodesulfovibrio aespoeensis Aspo-2]|jgi:hypothetical protein|uniref:Uncharacterized protein n=3 Tax=Desulfovibrionaceae TaxID=194924 RepID=E6VXY2_PSEA9|nr:hypothetical protein Daes_1677 [Pseudodesulfovibrio aespoeensis Aspo-2]
MSGMSISTESVSALTENLMRGAETVSDTTSTIFSSVNRGGVDSMEQTVAGAEVASRTSEFFGSGTDFSSTGTDYDTQQAVNNTVMSGNGSIADIVV